jgi:hypothetical protein
MRLVKPVDLLLDPRLKAVPLFFAFILRWEGPENFLHDLDEHRIPIV